MKRLPNWRVRLVAAIDAIERTPHEWGAHDCATGLAAIAVEAVTGVDLAARFRGLYSTPEGALKLLRKEGADSLEAMVGRYLPNMPLGDMRLGDLALVADETPFGGFLGVCNGERLIVLRPDGKGTLDRLAAAKAFRAGE